MEDVKSYPGDSIGESGVADLRSRANLGWRSRRITLAGTGEVVLKEHCAFSGGNFNGFYGTAELRKNRV